LLLPVCMYKKSFPAPCNKLMRPYVRITERFLAATPDRHLRTACRCATGKAGI
jgi:hypothetical protein